VKWRFYNNKQLLLQFGTYPQLLVPTGNRRAAWARVNRSCCRSLSRKVGTNGRFTATSATGGNGGRAAQLLSHGAVLEREINERLTLC
jgi:hypothetical protein